MSNKDQVYREIIEYLDKEDSLHYDDKIKYLMALFDKHFTFSQLTHVLNHHDLHKIVSDAKASYADLKTPMQISGRGVAGPDLAHVALILSVIMNFNGMGLLKKLITFNFTENR